MSSFTKRLRVDIEQTEWHGRGVFTIAEPFEYHVGHLNSDHIIVVPEKFQSDGCSIPWFARFWLNPLGQAGKAGVLHDFMLWSKKYDQSEAAEIFYEAMGVLEVPYIKRKIMYWSVKYWPFVEKVIQPNLD